jgi:outer membrane protein TolC
MTGATEPSPDAVENAAIQPVPALALMSAVALPIPPRRPFLDGLALAPREFKTEDKAVPPVVTTSPVVSPSPGPVPAIAPVPPKRAFVEEGRQERPIDRKEAKPATDELLITGAISMPSRAAAPPREPPRKGLMRLEDAVARAVLTYPEIRISQTRLRESKAGIDISRSALYPAADARLATGANFSGAYEGKAVPYNTAGNEGDNRFDGGIILRQLVWDFGATRADISRARHLSNAEQERLYEKIDEIAWRTAQVYLKILEGRALVTLIDETIAAHMRLLKIVSAQELEGHGTSADSSRIRSRLNDITAVRSDVSLQLGGSEDQFERLTQQRPGRLLAIQDYRGSIPGRPDQAITTVLAKNPKLASLRATAQSIESELEAQRASNKPKFMFELDSESKNFRSGKGGRTQIEGRAMLAMRFKLLDGGLAEAQERQIRTRIETSELTLLNERQQLEADIRQAYRAIESAATKTRLLDEGVSAAQRAEELFLEQFKAGKRSVFELLDGQMAVYTSRRSQIESRFERQKAIIDILRYTGALANALAAKSGTRPPDAAPDKQ